MDSKTLQDYPEVLTARMVAKYLGLGYVKALSLIKYGGIPHMKIGSTYRVSKKVFEAWLNEPIVKKVLV